jgi:hypothetical protein
MIPSEFEIFGKTIKVELIKDLITMHGELGEARPDECEIRLQPPGEVLDVTKKPPEVLKIPNDIAEETFWHEVVHLVLYSVGEEELYENEKFVTLLSSGIYQVLKTSKFENKEPISLIETEEEADES